MTPDAIPDDLSLQLVLIDSDPPEETHIDLVYSTAPVGESEWLGDLLDRRSILFSILPTRGHGAREVIDEASDPTAWSVVTLGEHEAALLHSHAPLGEWMHWRLYWADGVRDFVLAASTTPSEAVDSARSIYCD